MAGKLIAHVRSQWIGTLALLLVLTGGTAYALDGSNTVFTDDIVNGQVKTGDIGDGEVRIADIGQAAVAADELAADSVRAAEIAAGAVRTEELRNGQVEAEDLAPGVAPGASGARAWGLVNADGDLLRSKNVTSVNHLGSGFYCIDPGSGIDPDSAVMVVGETSPGNSTSDVGNDISQVEWFSSPVFCDFGTMEVVTFEGNGSPASGGETDVGGFRLAEGSPQAFTFVIP